MTTLYELVLPRIRDHLERLGYASASNPYGRDSVEFHPTIRGQDLAVRLQRNGTTQRPGTKVEIVMGRGSVDIHDGKPSINGNFPAVRILSLLEEVVGGLDGTRVVFSGASDEQGLVLSCDVEPVVIEKPVRTSMPTSHLYIG